MDGFIKTFSKTLTPLSLFVVVDGPVSVSSFDASFEPNIGTFVDDVDPDPNPNLKPAKAADWLEAAGSVVVDLNAGV